MAMVAVHILTPGDAFSTEKLRGVVASLAASAFANGLNVFGTQALGLGIETSSILFLVLCGNVAGYVFDIMFAKERFVVGGAVAPLPYTAFSKRFRWLIRSFAQRQFFRYLVTVIIDSLVLLALLQYTLGELDKRGVNFPYRNVVVAASISVFTFFLYNNILRFDWAYSDNENPVMNVVVIMWVTLVIMIYAVSQGGGTAPPQKSAPTSAPAS